MTDLLPTTLAKRHCIDLQEKLDTCQCLDFAGAGVVSTDELFRPEEGRLFGILVALDDQGNEVVLKTLDGAGGAMPCIDGYLPPVCGDPLCRLHCIDGQTKSLAEMFGARPFSEDAGDCAAIRLLNEAFKHNLLPLSMAAFHYGASDAAAGREHRQFYPLYGEHHRPVLSAMLGLDIIYRDSAVIVVNKPSGLLSVPGRGEDKQDCVVARLKRLFPLCIAQPSVHRLDMDTSGLLVLAFTQEAHRDLSIQFIKRTVHKRYVALLDGVVEADSGRIELAFRYDPDHKPRQTYDPVLGKWGTTLWEKVGVERLGGSGPQVTRVLFTPLTGRTHQLRVHSAHQKGLSHPIVGDPLYGTAGTDTRLMLHAFELEFAHPVSGKQMLFRADPDF